MGVRSLTKNKEKNEKHRPTRQSSGRLAAAADFCVRPSLFLSCWLLIGRKVRLLAPMGCVHEVQ